MNLEEIRLKFAGLEKDIQCAFCLNPAATNEKPIEGKATPDGKQAVAFLCDDHKDQEPKFAHQVSDTGRLTTIPVEDLKDTGTPKSENLGVQVQEQVTHGTEVTAKKIAADVKE
jgi:hypothetical protein